MPHLIAFPVRHAPLICVFLFLAFGLMAPLARGDGLSLHPPGLRVLAQQLRTSPVRFGTGAPGVPPRGFGVR